MKVAIIGATGAVGKEFIRVIEEHKFPFDDLLLFGSSRSAGGKMVVNGKDFTIQELKDNDDFKGVDIAFTSAGSDVSRDFASVITRYGALMIDNSSAFRLEDDVPLVVPEVNAARAKHAPRRIIANPNCTTIQMVVTLKPIETLSHIRKVHVATYQAASGAGAVAMEELIEQTQAVLRGEVPTAERFVHPLAFNILPQVDVFTENGYTKEEMKMYHETRKIMESDILVAATCVRVPVVRAHSEAIWLQTERELSLKEVRKAFSAAQGIVLRDKPEQNIYPMPSEASFREPVYVGRIRKDLSDPNGISYWTSADQIKKGAALNAVQIAEYLMDEHAL